jgi:prepilin-type N-terminal cleavage/methylation domain-containing protein
MALHGFTLIELLVVIAIISLLVTILMPSLQQAKALARDVLCKSNLRNIGMGVVMYAEDNDTWLQPAWDGWKWPSPRMRWYWALADPYLGFRGDWSSPANHLNALSAQINNETVTIVSCPGDYKDDGRGIGYGQNINAGWNKWNRDGEINKFLPRITSPEIPHKTALIGDGSSWAMSETSYNNPPKPQNLRHPGERANILMFDQRQQSLTGVEIPDEHHSYEGRHFWRGNQK